VTPYELGGVAGHAGVFSTAGRVNVFSFSLDVFSVSVFQCFSVFVTPYELGGVAGHAGVFLTAGK
jgi:hypothetical protein